MPTYEVFPLKVRSKQIINYSYIVHDRYSGHAAIVDPAWELDTVLSKLKEIGGELTIILLTHSHYDHVNLVGSLIRKFDARVVISWNEFKFYGFPCTNLSQVNHIDEVHVGRTAISCLLTPGHTAGGMCYLLSDSLFTGDTIFIEGCGICTAEGGCPGEMFESIMMLKRTVAPQVRVFPGHSYGKAPGCEFGLLTKENIYFQIDTKDIFIDFRMRKGQKNLSAFK
ncbi:MAG TPA: MBL fold metallo-hydrolase [Geobacteraceae bacterium]